ncbi:hypothetical protein K2173_025625 [Erythroxylum novogranatense]|uniref:Transmembrane protein n=1 Tax=Erythroxylum novogranatense TaxID=1862640 RepID=A0AAV8SNR8_9ROSI|nr:hypothetical protein K2173_025625 [Erythroxylum novogranatense]
MTTLCPKNSITYNGTQCACPPGFLLNRTTNSCGLFTASSDIVTNTGVDYYTLSFPETIFAFDSIRKFTQSQAVFLEATLVMLLSWLVFCFFLRFLKLGDGRNIWFKIRWWISRLDICFATRHWLDDRKVVVKRKTELGGTFSIASCIIFIGLFAALLYQIISKRNIEVHNVRATNAPDLAAFANDLEFNITTVSSMSCLNLRGPDTLVTGSPGFIDYRVSHLIELVNYTCWNTSVGPTISFRCNNCHLTKDHMFISWQFVDLPHSPATAVGYQFNLTAKDHADKKHVSLVSGTLKDGGTSNGRPVTFRGNGSNVLKFNLFPRIYHNLHDLRLIQPLFHEFLPGSYFDDASQFQASLEAYADGLVNTTLHINYLSSYIVEVENKSILGPVSFLADLGGLYCISIGIFFYFLVQCEYRIKGLRNEDSRMRQIRNRLKAQQRWDKLRKYVKYTWGCSTLDDKCRGSKRGLSCSTFMVPSVRGNNSFRGSESSKKKCLTNQMDSINFNQDVSLPREKHLKQEEHGSISGGKEHEVGLHKTDTTTSNAFSLIHHDGIPLPPPLEFSRGSEVEMSDIHRSLQQLYDYNVMLRDKVLTTQALLNALVSESSTSVKDSNIRCQNLPSPLPRITPR